MCVNACSSLQMIDVVIKNAAHLLVGYECKLLKLVTCLSYLSHLLLDQRDDVSPRWISLLKAIRTLAHNRVIQVHLPPVLLMEALCCIMSSLSSSISVNLE